MDPNGGRKRKKNASAPPHCGPVFNWPELKIGMAESWKMDWNDLKCNEMAIKCIEIRYDQFICVIGFTPSVLRASSVHFLFSARMCCYARSTSVPKCIKWDRKIVVCSSFLLGMRLIRRVLHELRHVQVRGLSICEVQMLGTGGWSTQVGTCFLPYKSSRKNESL